MKKIVLIMNNMAEDAKAVIKSIYSMSVIEEINFQDATELLKRCTAKESRISTRGQTRLVLTRT